MKIKLAILENDLFYVKKIMNVFNTRYSDKIQIYSFSEPKKIYNFLETEKIDVLAADDAFEVDFDRIPKRCGFAYLVDSADVESFNGKSAICKFQKAELIYKQILSIYSEQAGSFEKKWSDNDGRILDNAGNIKYIGIDGVIYDKTVSVVTLNVDDSQKTESSIYGVNNMKNYAVGEKTVNGIKVNVGVKDADADTDIYSGMPSFLIWREM